LPPLQRSWAVTRRMPPLPLLLNIIFVNNVARDVRRPFSTAFIRPLPYRNVGTTASVVPDCPKTIQARYQTTIYSGLFLSDILYIVVTKRFHPIFGQSGPFFRAYQTQAALAKPFRLLSNTHHRAFHETPLQFYVAMVWVYKHGRQVASPTTFSGRHTQNAAPTAFFRPLLYRNVETTASVVPDCPKIE